MVSKDSSNETSTEIQLSIVTTQDMSSGLSNSAFQFDDSESASEKEASYNNDVSNYPTPAENPTRTAKSGQSEGPDEEKKEPTNVLVISKEFLAETARNEDCNGLRNGKVVISSAATPTTTTTANNHDQQNTPVEEREQWDKPIEFLLSCISISVGLGNVWRFPFTCYENGGGCFLIVYLIVLTLIGRPIYFLELTIGQFSSSGQLRVWKMVPILKGVAWGQLCGTICVTSFYVSIMATTVFYFVVSVRRQLPWTVCDPSWAEGCDQNLTASTVYPNRSLAQLYFQNEVLKQRESIEDGIGYPEWRLTLCLLFSWVMIFFVIFKGVKSSGKSAYFTGLFPYVVILILLIRGVTLDGAWDGIYYFLVPQWDRLLDVKIWYAAAGQCFLSLGTGFGIITILSSYNQFNHNIYKDAVIISLADTFTSALAGITIFAILGNLAYELKVDVSKVVDAGPGLAFESLPYAIAKFSFVPQVFSILFFLMLFTIGLGSACGFAIAITTIITEEFVHLRKGVVVGAICVFGFLFGLIYVTPGGQFMVTLIDFYGVSFVLYVMAVLEVIGVSWFYGMDNIKKDIEFMLKMKLSWYWIFCWKYVVPLSLTSILIYSVITAKSVTHNGVQFPDMALNCGRIMAIMTFLLIPVCAVHTVWNQKRGSNLIEKIMESCKPAGSWGPKNANIRAEWLAFKAKAG